MVSDFLFLYFPWGHLGRGWENALSRVLEIVGGAKEENTGVIAEILSTFAELGFGHRGCEVAACDAMKVKWLDLVLLILRGPL